MCLLRWVHLFAAVLLFVAPANSGEPPSPLLRAQAERAAKAEDKFWALSDQQKTLSPKIAELNAQVADIESSIAQNQALLDGLRSGKAVEPTDPAKREATIHGVAQTISRAWFVREQVIKERGRIRKQELEVIPLEAARDELLTAREQLSRTIEAERPRRTKSLRLVGGGQGRVLLDASWEVQPAWRASADELEKDREALAEMRAKANVLQRQNLTWAQEFYDADQAWQRVLDKAIDEGVTLARVKIATQAAADIIDVVVTFSTLGGSAVARRTYVTLDGFLKGSANHISGRQKLAEIRDLANDRIGSTVKELVKNHLKQRFDERLVVDNIDKISRGPESSFGRIMGPLGNGETSDWTTVPTAAKWLTFTMSDWHAGGDRSKYGAYEGDYWRQRELDSKLLDKLVFSSDVATTFVPLGVDMFVASKAEEVAKRLISLELTRFIAWQSYNMGRDELKKTTEEARQLRSKITEAEQKLDAKFELKLSDGKTVEREQTIEVFLAKPEEAIGVGALSVALSEGRGEVKTSAYWVRKGGRQLIGSGRSTATSSDMSLAVFLPRPETVDEVWPVDLVIEVERGNDESAFDADPSTAAFLSLRPPEWKGYERGKDIYKIRLSVADPMLGYWKRLGPFKIVTLRDETLDDWPAAPIGFAIVDNPANDRTVAFLDPGGKGTIAASAAILGKKCTKLDRSVECRQESPGQCTGQWFEYRISLKEDGNGIFQVLDGELSSQSDQGCLKRPHPYLTGQQIELQRELPMAEIEQLFPCPEKFKCH